MVAYLGHIEKKANQMLQSYSQLRQLLFQQSGVGAGGPGQAHPAGLADDGEGGPGISQTLVTVLGAGPKVPMGETNDRLRVNPPKSEEYDQVRSTPIREENYMVSVKITVFLTIQTHYFMRKIMGLRKKKIDLKSLELFIYFSFFVRRMRWSMTSMETE